MKARHEGFPPAGMGVEGLGFCGAMGPFQKVRRDGEAPTYHAKLSKKPIASSVFRR